MQLRAAAPNLEAQQLKHASSRGVTVAARLGYAAHGVVYGLVGVLALLSALGRAGGRVTDSRGAVHRIGESEWGAPMLWAIALGLACYALWNLVRAFLDPEQLGSDGKAVLKRIGYTVSAGTHVFLSIYAFQLVRGAASGGGGKQHTIAQAFDLPGGRFAIGIVGVCIAVFGLVEIWAAIKNKVGREFAGSSVAGEQRRWVMRIARAGRFARGSVFPIIGGSLVAAAFDADPSEAHSFGQALGELASQPFGSVLLGVVAAGLVAYAVYQLLIAGFARIAEPH
jgi:hypothetical protein